MVTHQEEKVFLFLSLLSCGCLSSGNTENLFPASPLKVPALVRDRGNTVTQHNKTAEDWSCTLGPSQRRLSREAGPGTKRPYL